MPMPLGTFPVGLFIYCPTQIFKSQVVELTVVQLPIGLFIMEQAQSLKWKREALR